MFLKVLFTIIVRLRCFKSILFDVVDSDFNLQLTVTLIYFEKKRKISFLTLLTFQSLTAIL